MQPLLFKTNKKFLTTSNINFIKELTTTKFPFFLNSHSLAKSNKCDYWFEHMVLKRLEFTDNSNNAINTEPVILDNTMDILNNFCNAINEKPYFFTRITYNLTFFHGFDKTSKHYDHHYDHKQIIIYLNDCDKISKTIILDKNEKDILKEIVPEKNKGICFNKFPHYNHYPKTGIRLVLVATFI
jgi:hypothetical protein